MARLHCDQEIKPSYVREAFRLLKTSIIQVETSDVDVEEEEDGDDDDNGGGDDDDDDDRPEAPAMDEEMEGTENQDDMDRLAAIESERMSWCLADVAEVMPGEDPLDLMPILRRFHLRTAIEH